MSTDKGASIKYVRTEGEGGRGPKSVRSKGGCVNLVLQTWPKCVQGGGRGSKSRKISRTYLMDGPLLVIGGFTMKPRHQGGQVKTLYSNRVITKFLNPPQVHQMVLSKFYIVG